MSDHAFEDPYPVRLEVIDDEGNRTEAWIGDDESRTLSRALDVIR